MLRVAFWALLLGLLNSNLQAAYITDQLLAGLYKKPDAGGQPLQLLKSGTPLEVITPGDDFSRVRLADGSEGWLESVYLTEERPVRHRLLVLQARVGELERAAEQDPSRTVMAEQDQQLRQLAAALQQAHQQLTDLKANDSPDTYRRVWPWVLAVLALLLGFAAGVGVVERRLRQAHR